jgi:hypothetical protein
VCLEDDAVSLQHILSELLDEDFDDMHQRCLQASSARGDFAGYAASERSILRNARLASMLLRRRITFVQQTFRCNSLRLARTLHGQRRIPVEVFIKFYLIEAGKHCVQTWFTMGSAMTVTVEQAEIHRLNGTKEFIAL